MFQRKTIIFLMIALLAAPLVAQELTGELRGTVRLSDGTTVPGITVTAASPALLGERTTATTESGQWVLRGLPPGTYTVTFELEGMATMQSRATVSLGQPTPVSVTMQLEAESETIIVSGEKPSVLASSEISTTYSFEEVNNLPIDRTPAAIAQLAPGLTNNTPNGGQVTISGGFAYDNVFLIDGVDANDNLFGTSNPAYIEDAIADVQVLTSGISAEYGRFSGGVVNVITKSGGNEFSGTVRADLENPDWRNRTPIEEEAGTELADELSETYSATVGGYLLKDRLWFFAAGRDQSASVSETLFKTSLPFVSTEEEERYQLKGTFNILDRHQIQATYTDRDQTETDSSFSFSATPSTVTTRTLPNELRVLRYSGVLTDSLFAEIQASEKQFGFRREAPTGVSTEPGTDPAFVGNTPFRDFFGSFNGHYNAPYFDGTDPEDRDNEQLSANLSYFADSATLGSHDIKVGFEDFSSFRVGGNSQTPTDWVISADVVRDASGDPVVTNGEVSPDWIPGITLALNWLATRGAEVELQTRSVYVNDIWQLNDHWSFNIGARYEEVSGETNSNITTVDTDALVPRLAATYDVRGDGKYRFDATYSQYAGKYSEAQFAQNTEVGNPALLGYVYVGPAGQGYDFAPGYDIANNYQIFLVNDGTQNVIVDDGINSPVVDEITFSAGMELDRGGFVKAIFTDRSYSDFVEDFFNTAVGSTEVVVEGNPAGVFNNAFITNSDLPQRDYQAVQLIGRVRLNDDWTLDGNYTYQIENEGNFEGEGTNTPGISSIIGDYPEIRSPQSHFPVGPLNDFAENKLRLWTNYRVALGRAGDLNFGLLANWDSGRTFSRTDSVPLSATQQAIIASLYDGPGPANETIFFGGRGGVEFEDSLTFDLSVNYQVPVFGDFELWLKADVLNVFDDDTQIAGDTNVDFDPDGRFDSLGIPLDFTEPSGFGEARNNLDFVAPFEYRFTVGFRF